MAWSNNSSACTTLYAILTGTLDQLDKSILFNDAGTVTISQLVFFNATASPDIIRMAATGLANTLDSTLISAYLCSYKTGQTQNLAISGMVNILVNGQSTIANLADTIDSFYQFIA